MNDSGKLRTQPQNCFSFKEAMKPRLQCREAQSTLEMSLQVAAETPKAFGATAALWLAVRPYVLGERC